MKIKKRVIYFSSFLIIIFGGLGIGVINHSYFFKSKPEITHEVYMMKDAKKETSSSIEVTSNGIQIHTGNIIIDVIITSISGLAVYFSKKGIDWYFKKKEIELETEVKEIGV